MKKLNLLSRAEMKNVMGGLENVDDDVESGGGVCSGWWNKSREICYNCCIGWYQQGPPPVGNVYYSQCASMCGF